MVWQWIHWLWRRNDIRRNAHIAALTSQTRSRPPCIKYLIPSDKIIVLDWNFNLAKKLMSLADFNTIYWWFSSGLIAFFHRHSQSSYRRFHICRHLHVCAWSSSTPPVAVQVSVQNQEIEGPPQFESMFYVVVVHAGGLQLRVKMSAQRNETETKQFQNCFETALKLLLFFCFSLISLCGLF